MSRRDVTDHVNKVQPRNRTASKQARIVEFLHREGALGDRRDAVRTRWVLDSVPSATRAQIGNLVEADLVEEITPAGSDTYIYHERLEDRLSRGDIGPAVQEERRRLMAHLRSDPDALDAVADELGVAPSEVERRLRRGDEVDRMETLDRAVRAVERDPSLGKGGHDYGRIGFRRRSNRYMLTPLAVRLYRK